MRFCLYGFCGNDLWGCYLFDNTAAKFAEVKVPQSRPGEIQKKTALYYAIYDDEWIDWLKKIFWKRFRAAIPAKNRLDAFESMKEI